MNSYPYESLTTNEIDMMYFRIQENAFDDEVKEICDMVHLLRYWNHNKQWLFEKFGNKLILEKEIKFKKSYEMLIEEVENTMFENPTVEIKNFIHAFNELFYQWRYSDSEKVCPLKDYDIVRELIWSDNLAVNTWNGDKNFNIPTPDGRFIQMNPGCKVSKMLGKIAAAYNLPNYEEFRIAHSMILNQKEVKGKLCLSIHPLDYMTMSDNDSNWESCMSWENKGDYRCGTIEMMNSPMVVVAYLAASTPMTLNRYSNEYLWSNKKWRELFIVNENMICSVKSYPYANEALTFACLDWLKEVVGADAYSSKKCQFCSWKDDNIIAETGHRVNLHFFTNNMYNDFYTCPHYVYLNKNIHDTDITTLYSGELICMCCGKDIAHFSENYNLLCDDCNNVRICSHCGKTIYSNDEWYEVDGEIVCSCCYDNTCSCDECGDCHFSENMVTVKIAIDHDKLTSQFITLCYSCYDKYTIYKKKVNHWRSVEYVLLDDLSLAILNEIGYDDKEEFIKYNKDFIVNY